jgi:hypothetical protein
MDLEYKTHTKKHGNRYEPEVLEDKVDLQMYYSNQLRNVEMDETLTKIKAQEL